MMRFRPAIVVLAAGPGRRFGGPQPMLKEPFGGSTVLGSTVRRAVETQLPVVVVTVAALAPEVARQLAGRDIVVLDADAAARGLGHALSVGVAERSGAPGWLVLPGDMPRVRPGSIRAVASALEQHAVAFAQHRGRGGFPVGFAAELYSELIVLRGDDGPRRVMARYPAQGIELDDPGVLYGADTESDLEALRSLAAETDTPVRRGS